MRDATAAAQADLRAALESPSAALVRVESLLSSLAAGGIGSGRRRDALARVNQDVLHRPVVRWTDTGDHPDALTFPTVEESYVNPGFRLAYADRTARPADESWWDAELVRADLDLLLSAHFLTFEATRQPMLLLGHPGGGKSMLTKILAARLPAESYTVARVPLRQVVANAPIHDQIRQALELATHSRTGDWFEVADDGSDAIRVVLLDGLDELLQASSHDRSGYLRDVIDFQRVEAAQGRPVMVVVTSRTVVAERVDIPPGTPIVKLEEFDDAQVADWLEAWNRANAVALAAGRLRRLTPEAALAHPELARQPLLLLMLAIYRADPEQPADLDALSLTDLYQRLLSNFAVREVRKRAGEHLRGADLDKAVTDQLYRLSIAAIGVFNRGRQDITEAELGADLEGLERDGGLASDADSRGRRVLGEFFFVHAAEAQERQDRHGVQRCYEFLHATFGEYLIASLVVGELADVAEASLGGSRGPREPADDLLFALLSHQTLASRAPILQFAEEMLSRLPAEEQRRIAETLEFLVRRYDRRSNPHRYPRYQPLPESNLRSLAAYSANLVLLRVLLDDEVPISVFCLSHDEPPDRWRAISTLWRAGLEADGAQAMLDTVTLSHAAVTRLNAGPFPARFGEIQFARLLGDHDTELQLRIGAAFHGKLLYHVDGDNWAETMTSWLLPAAVLPAAEQPGFILLDPPTETPPSDIEGVLELISYALLRQAPIWSADFVCLIVGWVDRNFGLHRLRPTALVTAIIAFPDQMEQFSLDTYGRHSEGASWLLRYSDDRLLGGNSQAAQAAADHLADFVDELTMPVNRTPLPSSDGSSIFSMRAEGPVPMGATTESTSGGWLENSDPSEPI